MTPLMALLFALGAPTIDVSLAPDQPVPFVFVDDPLILQLESDADVKVTGRVEFLDAKGEASSIELPSIPLRAQGKHWQPLEGAPPEKGRYEVDVKLDVDGAPVDTRLVFCRIDRPVDGVGAAVCVRLAKPEKHEFVVFQGIPLHQVDLDASQPEVAAAAARAAKAGYQVFLFVDAAQGGSSEAAVETLSKKLGERVTGWAIQAHDDPGVFHALVTAIRHGGSRAPVAAVIEKPEDLAPYLAAGSGRNVAAAVLQQDAPDESAIGALRSAAEEAGYEGFAVQTHGLGVAQTDAHVGARVARRLIRNWAAGVRYCHLEPRYVYDGGEFGEAYVHLSALVRRVNGGAYLGELEAGSETHAHVFRTGSSWVLAAWTTDGPAETTLTLGDVTDLAISDDQNNALPVPEIREGVLNLDLSEDLLYITGTGGDVLAESARFTALREAKQFVDNKAFQESLPSDLIDLVKTVATSKTGRTERLNFFGLLRMFPFLEQQWHEGAIAKDVAVPAMASMARLVRALCVLEQEAGEPFIELLQETRARCGEYQSQYLTSTGGAGEAHTRADWLSREVGRLVAEAKTLSEQGREIEAVGVASLAEWRARALEFAARAAPDTAPEETKPAEGGNRGRLIRKKEKG